MRRAKTRFPLMAGQRTVLKTARDFPIGRSQSRSPSGLARELAGIEAHIREGRFQRSLSLMAGLSSVLAGVEVAYEHYKGSYG